MIGLRRLLLCDYIYIVPLALTIVISLMTTSYTDKTVFKENETDFYGYINEIEEKDDYYRIELIAEERLLLHYEPDTKLNLNLGDYISVEGKLERPKNNTVPNLFNYKKYLYRQKIYWILKAEKITKQKENNSILYMFKNTIIRRIEKVEASKEYLYTFILGDKKGIDRKIVRSYQTNGISHLFAISGMHIGVISLGLMFMLKKLKILERERYIITALFLLFYMFLTNLSPSVTRATAFFMFLAVNKICYLNIKPVNLLFLTCTIFLLINQYYIYDLGFQFSYTITFFLIIFGKEINKEEKYIKKLFTISLIAFLASLPIQIYNFFEINTLGIIINLIFVPFISLIIMPLSFLTFIFPRLDIILNLLTSTLETVSLYLENIDIFKIIIPKPSLFKIALYYFLIFISLKYYKIKNILFLPLIIFILVNSNINYIKKESYMISIDVGQGDSTLLHLPYNKGNILIDTGGAFYQNNYSTAENKTIPLLKSLGIKKLDYLIITHGDYDHCGEAINLINNFKIKNIIINSNQVTKVEQKIINLANAKNIPIVKLTKDKVLRYKKNYVYLLHPMNQNDENNSSIVTFANINGVKILMTGDLEKEGELKLISEYNIEKTNILKVGHHGSSTSTEERFILEATPIYASISAGKNNSFGHPAEKTLSTLKKHNVKINITAIDGSITYKLNKNSVTLLTCPP